MNHALMAEAKTKRFVSRCANVCGPPAICLFFPKLPTLSRAAFLTAAKKKRRGEEDTYKRNTVYIYHDGKWTNRASHGSDFIKLHQCLEVNFESGLHT